MTQRLVEKETLLLKQPIASADEIAFLYAGEIWISWRDGSHPRRLTAQKGRKVSPFFSPDGKWIAFSGNYDGNLSVYVISREGGSPRRLTFHPYEDWVRGWTPDGRQILFSSTRESIMARARRLFRIPFEGGLPVSLPLDLADRGAFTPDGKYLAFTPYMEPFWSWKRYRGGMTVPIWVMDMATYGHVEVPHENASDSFPCWVGSSLYFLSDRNQTMNIFRWDMGAPAVEQITFHSDYDVRSLTTGPDVLAYEQAGRIHLYDTISCKSTTLSISIAADLPETRPHYLKAAHFIKNAGISPTGQRAVFETRGDIFTVPAKKGDIRNLTRTPGLFERDPSWSPDGQSIAYFSDASGEYDLVIVDQKGGQKTVIPLQKHSFFYTPLWSPDSKKIAFTDKALNLYIADAETKAVTLVDSDRYDHPLRSLNPAWSPDSQWLAYTRRLDSQIRAVFIYHVPGAVSHQITDGMSDSTNACFSQDGKYLFFSASTNFGLNTGWLDMSSYDRPISRSLYVTVLSKDEPSPLFPESDEEKPPDEKASQKKESSAGDEKKPAEKKEPVLVKIDLEGLDQRIQALPVPALNYWRLLPAENRLFFMENYLNEPAETDEPSFRLNVYDFKERKTEIFVEKLSWYWVSADGKKLLYRLHGEPKFAMVGVEKKPEAGEGMLDLDSMEIAVDPRAEWQQMFREAYRIHRDFFYDPAYHGLDIEAAYQKYLPFLDHVGHRDDLNYLLAEFSGELVVGHAYVGAGDIPSPEPVQVGLLGADYEVTPDGYYRIKRIYPGLNWHPELRAPLTEPGVNVKEGEYILAVNGRPLLAPDSIFSLFEKTVDRVTDLRISPTTRDAEARTVSVRPIANEMPLRHWSWVEGNRRKVDTMSGGRVAYVYMPDTAIQGYNAFNRYYFSQLDKEAVVLDERFNNGGNAADYVVDLLDRPVLSYWATREGKPFATPNGSIFGPKVMIINALSGSGGDALPLFFRRRGLGKLVGKRTWGGLIGIYDYPPLMDGGFFSSPRMAIFSPDGRWEVENEGVAPDIEVEMTPKLVIEGRDPQLEKAVEVVLSELAANPPGRPARPGPVTRAAQPG